MRDKFTTGLISGGLAGLISSITDLGFVHLLKFGTHRYIDFAGVFVFGRPPHIWWEVLFAQLVQVFFSAAMGVLFIFLLDRIKKENLMIKGICFGVGIWFVSYVVTLLFKVPYLKTMPPESSVEHYLAAIVYGISLVKTLNYFTKPERD
jgi:hypothetical protein